MAVITKAYADGISGQIAMVSSVIRITGDLYTLQNGNINSANLSTSAVGTPNLEDSAVTVSKVHESALIAAKLYTEVFG